MPPTTESCDANAAEPPVHQLHCRMLRALKLLIARMDLKYLPRSCCG
jgi:hypothetical protein